jgi:hypothetical protein
MTAMQMKGVPLAPKKGRWPKSEHKQALRRYQLDAPSEALYYFVFLQWPDCRYRWRSLG